MKSLSTIMLGAMMPDCRQAKDATWKLVHGKPIALRDRAVVEIHLLTCSTCRAHRNHLKWLREGVANLTKPIAREKTDH